MSGAEWEQTPPCSGFRPSCNPALCLPRCLCSCNLTLTLLIFCFTLRESQTLQSGVRRKRHVLHLSWILCSSSLGLISSFMFVFLLQSQCFPSLTSLILMFVKLGLAELIEVSLGNRESRCVEEIIHPKASN